MTGIAFCALGAERVVSNELKKLELSVENAHFGKVRFKTDLAGFYKALIGLRAADRVLLETGCFPAEDFDVLFENVRAIRWEDFIPRNMGLKVAKVRSRSSQLRAVTSIQAIVHKAAADRLCKAYHIIQLNEQGPIAELRVYIEKNQVSVLLDISGEPLFKRGYRSQGGIAPLRETTGTTMLFLSNWRRKFPLYDPFCGSGTIVIEAALYAWNIAPGLGRSFVLSDLLIGNRELEQSIREEFHKQIDFSRTIRIYGSDADYQAVSMAKANLARALAVTVSQGNAVPKIGLPDFSVLPMEKASAPCEGGFIITNPPYGKRLGDAESAEKIYREMELLIRKFPGWKLGLITDHPGFESFLGRKADSCRELTNGVIPTYFFLYDHLS